MIIQFQVKIKCSVYQHLSVFEEKITNHEFCEGVFVVTFSRIEQLFANETP